MAKTIGLVIKETPKVEEPKRKLQKKKKRKLLKKKNN